MADGEEVYAEGKGTVVMKTEFMNIALINVLYVPSLHLKFLSISKFIDAGHTINFAKNGATVISKTSKKMMCASKKTSLFFAEYDSVCWVSV